MEMKSFAGRSQVDFAPKTRNWHAILNTMPPEPINLYVIGEVEVPNPGVSVKLVRNYPQGINPLILQLTLVLEQEPGKWPSVIMWKDARYDETPAIEQYTEVEIFYNGKVIETIKVQNVT